MGAASGLWAPVGGAHHQRALAVAFAARGMGQPGEQAKEAEDNQKQVEHGQCFPAMDRAVLRPHRVNEPFVLRGCGVKPE